MDRQEESPAPSAGTGVDTAGPGERLDDLACLLGHLRCSR
jgi:hypothetical protein